MVRLFGRSLSYKSSRSQTSVAVAAGSSSPFPSTSSSSNKKKRLSASARTPQARREHHPLYQYAVQEFAQTVAPSGRSEMMDQHVFDDDDNNHRHAAAAVYDEENDGGNSITATTAPLQDNNLQQQEPLGRPSRRNARVNHDQLPSAPPSHHHTRHRGRHSAAARTTTPTHPQHSSASPTSANTMAMPMTTYSSGCYYEESFGPAYTGGILTYVYPSGYQSMRPRSCPWKLSIVVCLLFAWLSIFIVVHCSGQSSSNNSNDDAATDDAATTTATTYYDDALSSFLAANTKWCGSRPLYLLWVASMLVTGLSASYCSIIGYIKVRDFAAANVRSQPCAVGSDCGVHKSDYYVKLSSSSSHDASYPNGSGSSATDDHSSSCSYRPSIYQSDGTPQFWGAHIYRPTQAAAAVTSR